LQSKTGNFEFPGIGTDYSSLQLACISFFTEILARKRRLERRNSNHDIDHIYVRL
jgi:hypothetical protein